MKSLIQTDLSVAAKFSNSNHPIIRTPLLFQETECLNIAFEHPRLKLLLQYPNTYTSRSSNGGGAFKRLLDYYCHCGARTGIAKRVPAFNSLCGARTGVAKHVLPFDGLCRARTGVAKCAIAFHSRCVGRTEVPKCLPDNPCGA